MLVYKVIVKTNKKQNKVYWKKTSLDGENGYFLVETSASPVKGKANKMVVELLANFLKLPKNSIKIEKGVKSKFKTVVVS